MKKHKKKKKLFMFAAILIALIIGFSIFLNGTVYPVVIEYANSKVSNMTTTAVNKAILSVLEGVCYTDLVSVKSDGEGNIQYIEANAVKINTIAQKTAKESKAELDKIGEEVLKIPLGSLTKSPLLMGWGPSISVKILTSGSVYCRFKSQFYGAGINQTLHKIYIEVCAGMDLILPASRRSINSTVEIFIAESVIAGKVPDAFLNIDAFGNFNFIPDK